MAAIKRKELNFLSLPYDIRHLIYEHLFPPGGQMYIQALRDGYTSIAPDHRVPASILRVCRQLHAETCEYLYNTYLFNIIGLKQDCMQSYDQFQHTVAKHARDDVHAYAFGNGAHSATICISLHAGSGKTDTVRRRERGVEMKIEQVRREVAQGLELEQGRFCVRLVEGVRYYCKHYGGRVLALGVALLAVVCAMWL